MIDISHHQKQQRRCQVDDAFAVACIGLGIVGIGAGFLEFATLGLPAWRQVYVPLSFFLGSALILWQGTARKTQRTSNLLEGVALFFLGNALGFGLCMIWNREALEAIRLRPDLGPFNEVFGGTIPEYSQEMASFLVVGGLSLLLGLARECCGISRRPQPRVNPIFRSLSHFFILGVTLIFTVGLAVFFGDPEKVETAKFAKWTVHRPPIEWQLLGLLGGLQLGGAAACFLAVLRRFRGRFLSTLLLVIAALFHGGVVAMAAVSIDLPVSWMTFQSTTTWILYLASTLMLLTSVVANATLIRHPPRLEKLLLPITGTPTIIEDMMRHQQKQYSSSPAILSPPTAVTQVPSLPGVPSYLPSASQLPSGVIFLHPSHNGGPTFCTLTPR